MFRVKLFGKFRGKKARGKRPVKDARQDKEQQVEGPPRPDDFGACEAAISIGIGCKKGCSGEAIAGLVARAMAVASCAGAQARLFSHEAKQNELGLSQAAKALGLPLVFLEAEALRKASLRAATISPKVMALYGLPSIAEAAALAGAGPSSILLITRMSEGGASCAIAINKDP